ncbi:MAG: hypothetical protein PHQ23_07425 [Candidatus Wallbacteria bacterium]|nr:hypothetical protein [Candidatus Wallbacteria bacterium]
MRREVRKTIPWVLGAAGVVAAVNMAMGVASGIKPLPMAIFALCWGLLLSAVIVSGVYAGMIAGLVSGCVAGFLAGYASSRVLGHDGPAMEIYLLLGALLGLLAGIASHWYGRGHEKITSETIGGSVMRRWNAGKPHEK